MCFMISSRRTGDVYCRCTSRDRKRGPHWPARESTTAVVMSPLEQPHLNIHHLWAHQSCLFGRNAARCGAAACRNIGPASPRSQQHGREMSETLQQVMFLSGWRPVCGSRVRQFASEPCTFRCSRASCLESTAGRQAKITNSFCRTRKILDLPVSVCVRFLHLVETHQGNVCCNGPACNGSCFSYDVACDKLRLSCHAVYHAAQSCVAPLRARSACLDRTVPEVTSIVH